KQGVVVVLLGIIIAAGGWGIYFYNREVGEVLRSMAKTPGPEATRKSLVETRERAVAEHDALVKETKEVIEELERKSGVAAAARPSPPASSGSKVRAGITWALRIASALLGLFFMCAVFFYEDEASRLQNKVDDFWAYLSPKEP